MCSVWGYCHILLDSRIVLSEGAQLLMDSRCLQLDEGPYCRSLVVAPQGLGPSGMSWREMPCCVMACPIYPEAEA